MQVIQISIFLRLRFIIVFNTERLSSDIQMGLLIIKPATAEYVGTLGTSMFVRMLLIKLGCTEEFHTVTL